MAETTDNLLISTRPSDSGLHVALHPLVLLTISDYATRHAARQQTGPIVGALLGQQQGRQITLEHAFECHTITNPDNEIILDSGWFESRVQQFRDVHKDPPLDIVGWFALTPQSGPSSSLLAIHRHILQEYNESALLLTFHPSQISPDSSSGAKLPVTVYESIFEGENVADTKPAAQVGDDKQALQIRFRELPFSIETGEAEMISVDFVARGAGNAMAIEELGRPVPKATATTVEVGDSNADESVVLSPENEEFIANLSTRLNAVKTLESRIRLIRSFLQNLPPSAIDGKSQTPTTQGTHSLLRNISALVSGLSLLTPQDSKSFAVESLAQENDVALISLLGRLGENVKHIRELGKKSAIVETGKQIGDPSKGRKSHMALQSRFDDELRESGLQIM
ncbi:COP9 signalosome subunit 6 (CsnF), putative [Talaromyces stipitatus ATCC 10500]|uniref:COP9 signalosome complex subunit 6 n=1 Tax=Talaromyces stipitatus (strain ATCC 10500 / CBS 375.48 / QM 6759 / NRRL 1006) TaxID=441959 RepID=B8MR95_TALSN|nr:COP9 signalosome subunit 6 (CsnF), putative [Talaromyces stipitatus ATCC 10500]EED12991.1 COP9 signalosome subunit 6 (CsnF), putative [Talaromyces stipitatus ATCC 10500]